MIIAICFLVGAVLGTWFLGWRFGLEVLGAYGMAIVGANSPRTFVLSKRWLESISQSVAAEVKARALRGK